MTAPPAMSPSNPDAETTNQKQARERRERRQAKIQSGGSARLQRIAGLSGREHAAAEEAAKAEEVAKTIQIQNIDSSALSRESSIFGFTPSSSFSLRSDHPSAEDPDIADISEQHYDPRPTTRRAESGKSTPRAGTGLGQMQQRGVPNPSQQGAEDPIMRMIQQMLGGGGGDPNSQLPTGLADMLSGMGGGGGRAGGAAGGGDAMPGPPQQGQQETAPSNQAYLWRIIHFLFSFALALYVTIITPFAGTKAARTASQYSNDESSLGQRLFYVFATTEVVLQSTRYFLERGQLPQSGILGTLSAIIPQPYGGYLRVVGRYSVIYTTVVADALVVVFVLGFMAWWNGAVVN